MGEDLELIPSSRSLPWRLDSHLAGPRERRGGLGKELETFHGFAARGEHRLRAFKLIALILRERNFSELVPSITQQDEGTIQQKLSSSARSRGVASTNLDSRARASVAVRNATCAASGSPSFYLPPSQARPDLPPTLRELPMHYTVVLRICVGTHSFYEICNFILTCKLDNNQNMYAEGSH